MATPSVAADPKATQANPKKGKMRSILLVIVGMVLGSGATFGALQFIHPVKAEEPSTLHALATTTETAEETKTRRIVAMSPLIVNVKDTRLTRYLKVTIGLELSNAKAEEELRELSIPIKDFLVDHMAAAKLDELDDPVGRNKLKRELLYGLNDILEAGKVTRLYFSEFIVQ